MANEHAMRARSRTRWRLTFTIWLGALVSLFVLTMVIDRSLLELIKAALQGRNIGLMIGLAAVFGGPLLIDGFRNWPRFRRRLRARSDHALAHWSVHVPSSVPRMFRAPDTVELSRRERAIMERGQRAMGVVMHHGVLTSVSFATAWGVVVTSHPLACQGPRPSAGEAAPILFEPGGQVGVAPTLIGAEFRFREPADTRQPLSVAGPAELAAAKALVLDKELVIALHTTLHPVEHISQHRSTTVGELVLNGELLASRIGDEQIEIRLAEAEVGIRAALVDGRVGEVEVEIRAGRGAAYRGEKRQPIRVRTELSQRRIGPEVPLGMLNACYVQPADFELLWLALTQRSVQPLTHLVSARTR